MPGSVKVRDLALELSDEKSWREPVFPEEWWLGVADLYLELGVLGV